jgi:hypothetical protein
LVIDERDHLHRLRSLVRHESDQRFSIDGRSHRERDIHFGVYRHRRKRLAIRDRLSDTGRYRRLL